MRRATNNLIRVKATRFMFSMHFKQAKIELLLSLKLNAVCTLYFPKREISLRGLCRCATVPFVYFQKEELISSMDNRPDRGTVVKVCPCKSATFSQRLSNSRFLVVYCLYCFTFCSFMHDLGFTYDLDLRITMGLRKTKKSGLAYGRKNCEVQQNSVPSCDPLLSE